MDTKETKKEQKKEVKKRKPITNFFGQENDEQQVQRLIATKGKIGGVRLG